MKYFLLLPLVLSFLNTQAQKAQYYKSNSVTVFDKAGEIGKSNDPVSIVVCKTNKDVFVRLGDSLYSYKIVSIKTFEDRTEFTLSHLKNSTTHVLKLKDKYFSLNVNQNQTIKCFIDEFKIIDDFSNLEFAF